MHKGEHIEEACKLLSMMGSEELIKEGRLQLINSYIERIPDSFLKNEP